MNTATAQNVYVLSFMSLYASDNLCSFRLKLRSVALMRLFLALRRVSVGFMTEYGVMGELNTHVLKAGALVIF